MKMTTNIFLFLVLTNAATGFFAAAGVWEDMGVSYSTSLGTRFDNVQDQVDSLLGSKPGAIASTLIGTITGVAGLLYAIADVVLFGTGKLLRAFDAPAFVIMPINLIIPTIVGKDIASFLSGRVV